MRELMEWAIAGGTIGGVLLHALREADARISTRARQDMQDAQIIDDNRKSMPLNTAMHPDALGVRLEESFQAWAQEQRVRDGDPNAAPGRNEPTARP